MNEHRKFNKIIGIVGGAGPMASAFFYNSILEICQKQYHASDYNEFPEIILVSFPFTRGNEEKIREEIALCISKLQHAGASLFCIASNSFHAFLPEVPKAGFVNLVAEGLKEAVRLHVSKALILAAQTTIQLKLYEQSPLQCIYPSVEDQKIVNKLIREIASGRIEMQQADELKKIITRIYENFPFDGIILACTELPLLHKKFPITGFLIVDTIEVLAKQLVKLSKT